MDMFKADAKVAEMLKNSGRFEILDDSTGRFTLEVDGEIYSYDVSIDTLTYGAGMDDASDVSEYMDSSNAVFCEVCTHIAGRLGWLDPVEPFDPFR